MGGWRIWLRIAFIFLAGAATALLGTGLFIHYHLGSLHRDGHGAIPGLLLRVLDWKLDLTADQEARVRQVMADTHQDFMVFRTEHQDRIQAIVDRGLGRIQAELTPDQIEPWRPVRTAVEEHLRQVLKK